uniref:C-type LECtin n=1 Tax=Panagrellus redivivus TaxID=6233 RepID=A0A7E4VGH7_PANRE
MCVFFFVHVLLFLLLLVFEECITLPTLCNNQNFDDHRHLYGQASVPCYVFRPGTCLVIGPNKVDISVAQMECTYKYGGQLVVPKNADDVFAITKRLHFYPSLPADYAESKFYLGLIGNTDYGDLRIDVSKYSNTLEKSFWSSVMMSTVQYRIEPSEYPFADGQRQLLSGEKVNQPAVGTCIDKMIGLNPTTAKFEVHNGNDKHYYLCETPRWPKYKCPQGYLLDRSQPMCYKAIPGEWSFVKARLKCREEKSVIGAVRLIVIDSFYYASFLTYLLNEDPTIPLGKYHVSQMTRKRGPYTSLDGETVTFCDDGSECNASCYGMPKYAFWAILMVTKTGNRDDPYQKDTTCDYNRIAFQIFGVICSVRPDQSKSLD